MICFLESLYKNMESKSKEEKSRDKEEVSWKVLTENQERNGKG